ncbi:MAG: class I SAM-dependent methyltransferase, partial [Pseudomonadales bacterium]
AQFADAGADIGADAGAGASADTDVDADANTVPDNDNKSLALAVADGQHLPFASQRFDKVICSEVLEHIPDHLAVVKEIGRVIKVGGILAVSVPRFFPEWICWRLSDAYHQVEGGHIHIFRAGRLRREVEATGFVCFRKHHAHALHVPYWWLKCLFWRDAGAQEAKPVAWYHRLLDWDLMQAPHITRFLDWLLNPLIGKSLVMYFIKTPDMGVRP